MNIIAFTAKDFEIMSLCFAVFQAVSRSELVYKVAFEHN